MLGLALLGLAAAGSAAPTVIFSPTGSLGAPGYRELPMNVDSKALEGTIEGLLGKPPSTPALVQIATKQPVVFLEAEGADSAAMQSLVSSKASAVGLPYAAPVSAEASVFTGATVATNAAELDQALAGRSLPPMLVIRSPEAFSLISKVDAVTKNYVAVATAPKSLVQQRQLKEKEAEKKAAAKKETAAPELVLPVTPTILTGLMAGLVWVTIFFAGLCCLMDLHVPDRFEEKVLQLNKEY